MDKNLTNGGARELVRLDNVSFQYKASNFPVLSNVSLGLSVGEVIAVTGRSGIGKSTLLRMVGGFQTPAEGSVSRATTLCQPGSIAYVDQNSTVFPWKTVQEIILLALSRSPERFNSRNLKYEAALVTFGLEGSAEKYPNELSGGMRQRLALAFAMLKNPRLLLLDEPFGSLDDFTKDGLYSMLQKRLKETETAVVIVTHSINECLTLSDKIIVLGGTPTATVMGQFTVHGAKPRSAMDLLEPEFLALSRQIVFTINANRDSGY